MIREDVEKDKRVWIVRENDEREKPTAYADYPNPKAKVVVFHPQAGAPKRGELKTRVRGKQGNESLIDNYSFNGEARARAEWTKHRLIYVTPELKKPVHVSGTPSIEIKLACDREAANLFSSRATKACTGR